MKVTFKTIHEEVFHLIINEDETILDIKVAIAKTHGEDAYPVQRLKLIYAGKILNDNATFDSLNFDFDKFIVIVVMKDKKLVQKTCDASTQTEAVGTPADVFTSSQWKSSEEMMISLDQIQKKLQQLKHAQTVAENQIQQTEEALKVARHTNAKTSYPNYDQEVKLLRTLQTLIERRRACYHEFGRLLKALDLFYIFPLATIRFTKIAVDVHRHLDVTRDHYAYFFVLVRYNEQVLSSQAVFINPMISEGIGSIEFGDIIEIEDVSPDFSMSIEIYGVKFVRKESDTSRFSVKRMFQKPEPIKKFARIGHVVINQEDLSKQVLELSSYETPLKGHCKINSSVAPKAAPKAASNSSHSISGPFTAENQEKLSNLFSEALAALRAAYPANGIPDTVPAAASNITTSVQSDSSPRFSTPSATATADETPVAGLKQNNEAFEQLREMIDANLEMLQEVIQQIALVNPALMSAIQKNPTDFLGMLNGDNATAGGGGAAATQVRSGRNVREHVVDVTREQKNAIDRITAMGFPEQLVIRAFLACDGNLKHAVDYIIARLNEFHL